MVRATKWFGWVHANNGQSTSWACSGPTLATALADGIRMASFAAGNGYRPTISLTEVCADCDGHGRITLKRFRTKPCKYCRGKGELNKIPPILFNVHSNTTIHN